MYSSCFFTWTVNSLQVRLWFLIFLLSSWYLILEILCEFFKKVLCNRNIRYGVRSLNKFQKLNLRAYKDKRLQFKLAGKLYHGLELSFGMDLCLIISELLYCHWGWQTLQVSAVHLCLPAYRRSSHQSSQPAREKRTHMGSWKGLKLLFWKREKWASNDPGDIASWGELVSPGREL